MDCTIIGEKFFKNVEFETQRGAENELPFFYVCGKKIQVFDLKNNEKVLCMLGTLNTI